MTISEAVAFTYRKAGWKPDSAVRGPVPLAALLAYHRVEAFALPQLTTRSVAEVLQAKLIVMQPEALTDLYERNEPIDGFLFRGKNGYAFVDADATLARRRFTIAHELGHMIMHADRMGEQLSERNMEQFETKKDPLEIEANKFAAEMLMPEIILHARRAALEAQAGRVTLPVLIHQLAGELLISREAIKYRLAHLGVGHE